MTGIAAFLLSAAVAVTLGAAVFWPVFASCRDARKALEEYNRDKL